MNLYRDRLVELVAVCALMIGALVGCGQRSEVGGPPPVLIVGIDGATFRVMDPLIEAGKLPVFAEMKTRGASGVLNSMRPTRSPALWTTIATGVPPTRHGIRHFTVHEKKGQRLVSSADRQALALWDIAGAQRRTTGFVGWWATWPAEVVNGWMVTDRMTSSRWQIWTSGSARETRGMTYPGALARELEEWIVNPLEPPMEEIDALVEFDDEERAEFLAARRPVYGHAPSVFKFAYASQRSYEEIALDLLSRDQPDLAGIFLIANDPVSHTFWHYYQPTEFAGIDLEQAERLGQLVPNMYRHNDQFLARLLELVSPETVLIVVSDHGFRPSGIVPTLKPPSERFGSPTDDDAPVAVGQSGRHALDGVFLAMGGPILPGVSVKAELVDIAPTVLALLGLPVPDDFPGRVLEEMIDPAFFERVPRRSVPTYEGRIERQRPDDAGGAEDEASLEMLRSLGYIE